MDDLPPNVRILKSLVAPARHGDGPTLYLICCEQDQGRCVIYERLPDGKSLRWPEAPSQGVKQAEAMIHQSPHGKIDRF